MNVVLTIFTGFAAYYAWKSFQLTQFQVADIRSEQQRQFIDRTIGTALDDFQNRYSAYLRSDEGNNDPFLKSIASFLNSSAGESKTAADERYVVFRTANYALKPLAYWCTYASERNWTNDENHRADLEAAAYRILAGISSSCFVYLYLTDRFSLEKLRIDHDGIERALYSHKKIWDFLRQYIDEELEHTKSMNAGQYKKIENHLQTLGKDNETIRQILFIDREQLP